MVASMRWRLVAVSGRKSEGKALRYRPGQADKLARLRQWCGPNANLDDKWKAGD
jgi:hypothetical protein